MELKITLQPKQKVCPICGIGFKTYPSKEKLGRGKYCSKGCMREAFKGRHSSPKTEFKKGKSHRWHKHITYAIARNGGNPYRLIYVPDHPNATKRGYVREHRLVAEKILGRYLFSEEIVHHVDGNTLNNSPSNLVVMVKKDHDRMNVALNIHRRWNEGR